MLPFTSLFSTVVDAVHSCSMSLSLFHHSIIKSYMIFYTSSSFLPSMFPSFINSCTHSFLKMWLIQFALQLQSIPSYYKNMFSLFICYFPSISIFPKTTFWRFPNISFFCSWCGTSNLIYTHAVSYTHLDVYKRQCVNGSWSSF